MSSVGIFCGSANGNDPVYSKAAKQVGQRLAEQGVGIVYGGERSD